jgi:hypothetical protein
MTRTVVLGQKAYTMLGGGYMASFTYFVEYDFDTGQWTALACLPMVAPQLAVWKGRIYAFSGGTKGNRACVYDPAQNQWTEIARMDMPRWEAGVAVFKDKIWLVGGHSLRSDQPMDGNVSPSVVCLDPDHNQWSAGPELPSQRGSVTAVVVNGRLFVMGGVKMGDSWTLDPSVLEYIPEPENSSSSLNTGTSSELRLAATVADWRLTLKWPGSHGQTYRLWHAPTLGEPWQMLFSAIPAEFPQTAVTLPVENSTAFFRLETLPAP